MQDSLDIIIQQNDEYFKTVEDLLNIIVKQNQDGNSLDSLDNILLNNNKVNKELKSTLEDGFGALESKLETLKTKDKVKKSDYSKLLASINRKSKRTYDTLQLIKGQKREELGGILQDISNKTTDLIDKKEFDDVKILDGLDELLYAIKAIKISDINFEFDYDKLNSMQEDMVQDLIKNVYKVDLDKYQRKEEALAVKIYDKDGYIVESFGGGGGGYSQVNLKNKAQEEINPATEEKQDDMIAALDSLVTDSEEDPTNGYNISDTDEAVGDGTSYFGYLYKTGAWYIQKGVTSSTVTNFTYVKGDSGYDFSNRASESYDTFDNIF